MSKLFIFTSALAVTLSMPATAQEKSVSVPYGDLDLTSESGIARLDRRIDNAVDQVCGTRLGQKALSETLAIRKCARTAADEASVPRQVAIDRARGREPSVYLAASAAPGRSTLPVRQR